MIPMKDVGEVAETRPRLAKFKSAWAITPSKIVNQNYKITYTSSCHRKNVYKISSESDERYRRSCRDNISLTDGRPVGRMDGRTEYRTHGRNNAHTDGRGSFL